MEKTQLRMMQMVKRWTELVAQTDECNVEHIEYVEMLTQAQHLLKESISDKNDLLQFVMGCLKIICNLYQGDWCGVLDVEEDVSLWTSFLWYDANDETAESPFARFESTEPYPRWVQAMHDKQSVVVTDVELIRKDCPTEYAQLKKQGIHSVIGSPYQRRTTGFLIVKNPKRFVERTCPLYNMAHLISAEIDEYNILESANALVAPELAVGADFTIELFGEMQITGERGTLREEDMNAPKVCRMLAFLALNSQRCVTPNEIVHQIWPDEAIDNPSDRMKNLVYRLRQMIKEISEKNLVVCTGGGYQLNPELNITMDVKSFEMLWQSAAVLPDKRAKKQFLKKAMKIYKGNLFPMAMSEHWLILYASYYTEKYLVIAERLFAMLEMDNDYNGISEYAREALKIERGNARLYYWFILALNKNGSASMARIQMNAAREALLPEEYEELIQLLGMANITKPH